VNFEGTDRMYLGLTLLCHECTAGFGVVELLKLVMRDTRARITAGGEEKKGEGKRMPTSRPSSTPVPRLRLQQARWGSSSPANPQGASADKATAIEQRRRRPSDGSVIKSLTSLASEALFPCVNNPPSITNSGCASSHNTTQHNLSIYCFDSDSSQFHESQS